jgi:putative phosphoesterase
MRIAVIADTHNRLPSSVRAEIAGADEIWHLGDICTRETLDEVRGLGPPLYVIAGNCDPRGLAPETLSLERGGKTFFLVHEPLRTAPDGADFLLHGHTHVPRDEMVSGTRFLNPGSVGKANHGAGPSFAWLSIGPKGEITWKLVPVSRDRG